MPRKRTSPPTSSAGGLAALAEALSLAAWVYLMGELNLPHAEQHAAQDMRDRAQDLRAAAITARDLAFEMATSNEGRPWSQFGVVGPLPRPLEELYKKFESAFHKAFRPSSNEVVDFFITDDSSKKIVLHYVGTSEFSLATANADAVWKFGVGLRRLADLVEVYLHFSSVETARKRRISGSGNLPDQALHYLVSALSRYGIGFREAAWKIATLGIELDAPVWTVQPRAPDAIDLDEVLGIEDRLKKAARRSRARARGD
jgi:hypothetical protein